jgi:hypothetical protein
VLSEEERANVMHDLNLQGSRITRCSEAAIADPIEKVGHGVSIHHINVDAVSPRLLRFGPLVHPNAKSAARIGGAAL